MKYILLPEYIGLSEYNRCIDFMIDRCSKYEGVIAIYQLGSISTPGISDIDLLVIFEDDAAVHDDPRKDLSRKETYLFTHSLFGTKVSDYVTSFKYSLFETTSCLYGAEIKREKTLKKEEMQLLKNQVAFEYLIQMFITCSTQLSYGLLKIRPTLLHIKALLFDLEYLGVSRGTILEQTKSMIDFRENWFSNPDVHRLGTLVREFYSTLHQTLRQLFFTNHFFVPDIRRPLQIFSNIYVKQGTELTFSRTGFLVPRFLGIRSLRYFNLLHRLNRFDFQVPMQTLKKGSFLENRYRRIGQVKNYNKEYLPHFAPLVPNLNYFR